MEFQELGENIPFPTIIVDNSHKIVHVNRAFTKVINKEIMSNSIVNSIFTLWENLNSTNSNVILAKFKDKDFIFLKSNFLGNKNEQLSMLIGHLTSDIVNFKEQIKELEKLNRELDIIIEKSYDGIYITDDKGVTLKTNSAIERITKIPKEYYIGKSVDALISRGILSNSVTYKVLNQRRTVSMVQVNNYGKEILITGSPVFNEEGNIEKIVTNIRDLSDLNELLAQLNKANEENKKYKKELERLKSKKSGDSNTVIHNEKMKLIFDTADRVANVDATVLILGETGVGKDVLAKYIYQQSMRFKQGGQYIKINCGAIPAELLESELFGYEGGAFTGANRKGKPGMFELANKGVLFLDEIGELPLHLQVKLLRVLQEKEIVRIGSTMSQKVDVRVIAATNRNLKEMVSQGEFREDLFYRLNVIPIFIPPLRERRDDILPLMQVLINAFNKQYNFNKRFSSELKDFFFHNNWPGNIRELSNLIERMILTTSNDLITLEELPNEYNVEQKHLYPKSTQENTSLKQEVENTELRVLEIAVQKYNNTYEIAEGLHTSQATIVRKLKKYGLKILNE